MLLNVSEGAFKRKYVRYELEPLHTCLLKT